MLSKSRKNPSEYLLAIDPGPTESAYARIYKGQIIEARKVSNAELLACLLGCSQQYGLTIEMISSYGMPVGREVFDTCVWIGRFQQACKGPSRLVYRKTIVSHVCGVATAKDSNVRQAVMDHFGAPGTKKSPGPTYGVTKDCWAALGVAIYAMEVPLECDHEQD